MRDRALAVRRARHESLVQRLQQEAVAQVMAAKRAETADSPPISHRGYEKWPFWVTIRTGDARRPRLSAVQPFEDHIGG